MKYILPYIAFFILFSGISSCQKNDNPASPADQELTVSGVSEDRWTYISLENNKAVGTSPIDDTQASLEWDERDDWDIAICGNGMLRTNGGASRRLDGIEYDEATPQHSTVLDKDRPEKP